MIKLVIAWLSRFFYVFRELDKHKKIYDLLQGKVAAVESMREQYETMISKAEKIYTPVRSFNSEAGDKLFWPWVKVLLSSEEYKYLIFSMRENVIRELVQASDVNAIHDLSGRLKMLQIIDNFLTTGLIHYDNAQKSKVQRDS